MAEKAGEKLLDEASHELTAFADDLMDETGSLVRFVIFDRYTTVCTNLGLVSLWVARYDVEIMVWGVLWTLLGRVASGPGLGSKP
jgi:hypothetical protein